MSHKHPLATLGHSAHTLLAAALFAALLYLPLGCSVGATSGAASPLQKEQTAESTGVVPSEFFGMVVKTPGVEPGVAAASRRLWDSGVTWAALEPASGSFVWTTLDAEVAAAAQAGAQVTLTLGMTPAWASSQPGLASSYGAGATAMPANLADWDAYVTAVATRYRGRISAYEVWNAPENAAYWSGAPGQLGANLAVLATHTASAVHSMDPAAVVVSPALSPAGLAAFIAAGGGAAVDVVGSALNGPGQAPEDMSTVLQQVRGVLVGTAADGKPVWNDGSSWLLPQGGLPAATQGAYVARALLLGAGLGVGRMHWYAWDESDASALLLADAQGMPTPAANAYATVEGWLAGAQMNGCSATAAGVWTCQLVRGGQTEWGVWSTGGSVTTSSFCASKSTYIE